MKKIDYRKLPYLETKVVKVKEGRCKHQNVICKCEKCGEILVYGKMRQPKGNWVNGENLDKIKFPCFCSYNGGKCRKMGFLSMNNGYYYVANIDSQEKEREDICGHWKELESLIKEWDIHILKGKIIIFEEEK